MPTNLYSMSVFYNLNCKEYPLTLQRQTSNINWNAGIDKNAHRFIFPFAFKLDNLKTFDKNKSQNPFKYIEIIELD